MIEEYLEKIKVNKEVLEALPQNNKKNRKIYLEKVNSLIDEYNKDINSLKEEIKRRNKYYLNVPANNIDNKELNELFNNLILFNPYTSSYEISTLDRLLYKLGHYYYEDINGINKTIFDILDIYKEMNIKIDIEDFNYSYYSKIYLEKLFSIDKKDESYLEMTKNLFKEYYWKCPDLINHITLNLKHLYYSNKSLFDNFYIKEREKYKDRDLKYEYICKRKEYNNSIKNSKQTILDLLLISGASPADYEKSKIESILKSISSRDDILEEEILELKETLEEYKEYMNLDYIIQDITKLYGDKDKYKGIYNKKKKEIIKKEKKVFSENKKIKKYIKKNNIKKIDYYNNLINNRLNELKNDYEEVEKNYFLEKVALLSESSTILDILELAYSNYNYLVELVKTKDKNVNEEIERLSKVIYEKNINLINNIWINDKKDLPLIICDKYNIFGFKLTKEMLEVDTIDVLLKSCEQVLGFYSLKRFGLDSTKIKFIKESKKILEDTNN